MANEYTTQTINCGNASLFEMTRFCSRKLFVERSGHVRTMFRMDESGRNIRFQVRNRSVKEESKEKDVSQGVTTNPSIILIGP